MAQYKRLPWFKFFVVDWLTDPVVCALNLSQQGLFLRLLCLQWREGSLPLDLDTLRRVAGVGMGQWMHGGGDTENDFNPHPTGPLIDDVIQPLYSFVDECFPANGDGRRRNKKLESIREELVALYQARVKGGKRHKGKGNTRRSSVSAQHQLSNSSASAQHKLSNSWPGVDIDLRSKDQDLLSQDLSLHSPEKLLCALGGAESKTTPTKRNGKSLWWDEENKRIWGTEEARSTLRTKWLARGLTNEEFQSQIGACNRWLEDHEEKRTARANLKSRVNNWLNKYLTDAERIGK